MQAAFLTRPTTGTVRGTRTTPLRDNRAVSLYIKPTQASPPVEEPRQFPWLACFIGLSAILALVNVFIPPVTQEGPRSAPTKRSPRSRKQNTLSCRGCCRRGIGAVALFTFDRRPGPPQFLGESPD